MRLSLVLGLTLLSAAVVVFQVVDGQDGDDLGVGHDSSRKKITFPDVSTPEPCPAGCKGEKGEKGTIGRGGRRGNSGDRGYRGPPAIWPPWPKGATSKGDPGQPGEPGAKGSLGNGGVTGDAGEEGIDGDAGEAGRKGAKGRPGRRGQVGGTGDQGSQGPRGASGRNGRQGDMGVTGSKGDKGQSGEDGRAGAQGGRGDDGLDGDPGAGGMKGAKGPVGSKGEKGNTAPSGSSGIPGDKGFTGSDGDMGKKGRDGKLGDGGRKGQKGETGPPIDTKVITADACTSQLEGQVRYEPDLQGLYYCDGKEWRCLRHKPCTGVKCGNLNEGDITYKTRNITEQFKDYACVVTLIDESGTMSGEQEWLPLAIAALQERLVKFGIGITRPNLYAMVGFGVPDVSARVIEYISRQWYSAADFAEAAKQLKTDGDTEDGFYAVKFAIDSLSFPDGCARNFLLVTDEKRAESPQGRGLTAASTLQLLEDKSIILNVIANIAFKLDSEDDVFGVDNKGYSFAVGRNDYIQFDEHVQVRNGRAFCESYKDYGEIALESNGAVWDLETLREGTTRPAYATSFTNALTEVKSREIVSTSQECDVCECRDDGLGNPATQCTKSTNQPYCLCRATLGGTEQSCRRLLGVGTDTTTRAPFDPSSMVPADCANPGN